MAILKSHAGTRVGYSNVPNEGPLSISYSINFASGSSYSTNIVDFLSKGDGFPGLSCIQSLWIDNSQNTSVVSVYFSQTNQTLYIPAQTQGYYPVLSPEKGTIIFSSSGSSIVNVSILNFLAEESQWYPYGGSVSILGVVNVNVQGQTYTGGYLNTLDATLAAIKGTETLANSLPVYQTNLPLSYPVTGTVAVSNQPSSYPVTGSVSVSGQTYNGGYLNTQDSTLAAIKGSQTQANSLPVYNTNPQHFISLNLQYNTLGTYTVINPSLNGLLINTIIMGFTAASYYSSYTQQYFGLENPSIVLCSSSIYLPTSSPSGLTNSYVCLNLSNLNLYSGGGLFLFWNSGGLTQGALNLQLIYAQSNS
jgi:hypothetical protein